MQKFLALALLVGCQATEPRLLQQATTTPPVTTTPGPTTTTTPGFTNQISFQGSTPSGGGRRLSAVTRSQLLLATCKAFTSLTAACSASIGMKVYLESGMTWDITAYLTTTAANAATQTAALNAYKSSPTSLGNAMTAALATVGATATMSVSSVAVTEVAARPYAPSPPAAAMPDKPFIFQFPVSGGTAVSRWQANQTGTYNLALLEALVQIGFPNGYVGAEFTGEVGAGLQANVTVYPPLSAVNSSAAVLQYLILNPATLGTVFTEKVQARLPEWKTAAATITFLSPQTTPFQLPTQVQGVLGTVVTINANTPLNTTYTGVADSDPNTYGVLYDADDDSEDKEETAAKYSTAAWTLPLAGVFGLFLMISFIGVRHNRKKSTRQFEHLHLVQTVAQTEAEQLVDEEEGAAQE